MLQTKVDDLLSETSYMNKNVNLENELIIYEYRNVQKELNKLYNSNANMSIAEIYSIIEKYKTRIMRLKNMLDPKFNIMVNHHSVTGINYLTGKGYSLNDDWNKIRNITVQIGRLEDFPEGIKDKKAIEIAKEKTKKN